MTTEPARFKTHELPPTVAVVGDPRGKKATWSLIPVDTMDGKCSQCAVQHDPDLPHDQRSLAYQYTFYAEHDRWPTWADAMAHCDSVTQACWTEELRRRGIDLLS